MNSVRIRYLRPIPLLPYNLLLTRQNLIKSLTHIVDNRADIDLDQIVSLRAVSYRKITLIARHMNVAIAFRTFPNFRGRDTIVSFYEEIGAIVLAKTEVCLLKELMGSVSPPK